MKRSKMSTPPPRKTRNRVTAVVAMLCCVSMLVGVFAFFTDRTTENATATAGNIDLVFTDTSAASESYAVVDDNGTLSSTAPQARDKVWENSALLVENGVLNPGDTIDMGYKLENTGSKSIDVLSQLVLTSSVALTDDAEEYTITVDDLAITPTKSTDDKTLTYAIPEYILNGSVETEDGVTITAREFDVEMTFARAAKNKFMDSEVSVTLDVQAKQHRNTTNADWVDFASYTSETDGFEIIEEAATPVMMMFKLSVQEASGVEIENETFTFEQGMTWREWVESDYNTEGYTVSDGSPAAVCHSSTFPVLTPEGNAVYDVDLIDVSITYHTLYEESNK